MDINENSRYIAKPYFEFTSDARAEAIEAGLPERATNGSAGYDFTAPEDIVIEPGQVAVMKTDIRALMPPNLVCMLYVRSSVGIKRRLILANGTGIIDSDYAFSDGGGNIHAALWNVGDRPQTIHRGERYMQGVFVPFIITKDDEARRERNGGIGSTDE